MFDILLGAPYERIKHSYITAAMCVCCLLFIFYSFFPRSSHIDTLELKVCSFTYGIRLTPPIRDSGKIWFYAIACLSFTPFFNLFSFSHVFTFSTFAHIPLANSIKAIIANIIFETQNHAC